MTSVAQDVVAALSLGGLYALFTLGIALIFGVANIVNFAHGQLIMASAYVLLALAGSPWPIMIAGAIAAPILLALAMERLVFRQARHADPNTLLIMAFGISGAIQAVVLLIEGATPKSVDFGGGLLKPLTILGVDIPAIDLLTLAVVAALLLGLTALLQRTDSGVQLRAAAEDFTMARLLGVRADRVIAGAFALSGLLAGVAAILLTVRNGTLTPTMGVQPLLVAFVATVIGGLGSLSGAVLGGMTIGALTIALDVLLPQSLQPYRDAFLYGGVIAVLVFRPQGILPVAQQGVRV